jgi:hypothetical protein
MLTFVTTVKVNGGDSRGRSGNTVHWDSGGARFEYPLT